jgi:hypothetical protein
MSNLSLQAYFSDGVAASEDPDVIVGAVNAAGKTDGPAFRPTAANQQRRGNGNAYRRFRRQFNNFDLKSARLNAHTRRSARQLAAAKKDATAESLRSAELELKQYAKHVRSRVLLFLPMILFLIAMIFVIWCRGCLSLSDLSD